MIMDIIGQELSEPYPILTYRYFVQGWPELTFLVYYENEFVGCIVNKLDGKQNKQFTPDDFRIQEGDF